jgi:hypothetical protein
MLGVHGGVAALPQLCCCPAVMVRELIDLTVVELVGSDQLRWGEQPPAAITEAPKLLDSDRRRLDRHTDRSGRLSVPRRADCALGNRRAARADRLPPIRCSLTTTRFSSSLPGYHARFFRALAAASRGTSLIPSYGTLAPKGRFA